MYRIKQFEVWASEIAGYLNSELVGQDFLVKGPSFVRTFPVPPRYAARPPGDKILLLTATPVEEPACEAYIVTSRPELDMGYVLREFFATAPANTVHSSAVISEGVKIGRNVRIGAHTVIGPDVEIGDNSVIMSNVVINGPAVIGKYCVIKDGAVIGSEGWGFVHDDDGVPFHPPQFGRIVIEDRVWVGSNSTIERAMVEDTVISANAKVDDLVHIGGGTVVGARCMLTAGSVVAYNVVLGDDVRVAPQSVIRENLSIAANVMVGQGAVVIDNLTRPGIYVGNPARFLRSNEDAATMERHQHE